jgi:hypothetical protein
MSEEQSILICEARRSKALIDVNLAILEDLLHDELIWTHSSARVESKKEFLSSLVSGATQYLSIELHEQMIRKHGIVTLVTGVAKIRANIKGNERSLQNRYLAVWVMLHQSWRMAAWQSTATPPSDLPNQVAA